MYFGAEAFSTANLLKAKILTVSDNFEINVETQYFDRNAQ
jgi:hypothetical protein